jgi:N-methylhydantoinase A
MRISVDIGGTFTDLVLERPSGVELFKAATIPSDPVQSVFDVVQLAADSTHMSLEELLAASASFVHATTRALNAVLTGTTARTAFLTTEGHPDVLVLREGGRGDLFDFTLDYPKPYVPRSLTYEVPGRITSSGAILSPLDVQRVDDILDELPRRGVEAVAVCLLWSTVNPAHELQVGERLRQRVPAIPFTLSHRLSPTIREYRRATSTSIDASLKPIMSQYLQSLTVRLREFGFAGRLLMVTSTGGVLDVGELIEAPIHCINSGPSMAPVAGEKFATRETGSRVVLVADAGGTTYDVTVVRDGRIPWTREAWIGPKYSGHMTGFPSIEVTSVGAGGGSIAWVDSGGLLHVGPQSAGAVPGPACYGRGGMEPTVTDAALALGYLDPAVFAGGAITLDEGAARAALDRAVAKQLDLDTIAAAAAVMDLATEQMVRAIEELALRQGLDASEAVLVGGGGAAGLNAVSVARRLGCPELVIPDVGATLAAAGALMSDLIGSYAVTAPTTSAAFDADKVNAALDQLRSDCRAFVDRVSVDAASSTVDLYVEAHYPEQIWDLEVPVTVERFVTDADVGQLVLDFHEVHERTMGVADPDSVVEMVTWGARVRYPLDDSSDHWTDNRATFAVEVAKPHRDVHYPGFGTCQSIVRDLSSLRPGEVVAAPAIIESPFTTVVLPPGSAGRLGTSGSFVVKPG